MAANLADDIFKYIFMNDEFSISIRISFQFVPRDPIDNMQALVQVMDWSEQATNHDLNQP